jgi:membrane fusion protein
MQLFRQQVLDGKQHEHLFGEVIRVRPMSITIYTILLLTFTLGLLLFLFLGTYARKETARGTIVPLPSLIKVYPSKPGIVSWSAVEEGKAIKKGDVLFVISTDQFLEDARAVQGLLTTELDQSISLIEEQISEDRRLAELRTELLTTRIKILDKQVVALKHDIALRREEVELYRHELERLRTARTKGLVTEDKQVEGHRAYLVSQLALRQLVRDQDSKLSEQEQLRSELTLLPAELRRQILIYERDLSALKQQLAVAHGAKSYTILAPADGYVASVLYYQGDTVHAERPLLSILPSKGELSAELYVPSRAIGFVREGQEVLLRYDGFPYERFGFHKGLVQYVSKSVILPQDVPLPVPTTEPVYKVSVALDKQAVAAYGTRYPLKVGMLLHGDIVLGHDRVITWILEPLYSLRGNI